MGETCARLHLAAYEFPIMLRPRLTAADLRRRYLPLSEELRGTSPEISNLIASEIEELACAWPTGLPDGIIHGDINSSNAHFLGDKLTGVFGIQQVRKDFLAFEILSAVHFWCFHLEQGFVREFTAAVIEGYSSVRRLDKCEVLEMPFLARCVGILWFLRKLGSWLEGSESRNFRIENLDQFLANSDMQRFLKIISKQKSRSRTAEIES